MKSPSAATTVSLMLAAVSTTSDAFSPMVVQTMKRSRSIAAASSPNHPPSFALQVGTSVNGGLDDYVAQSSMPISPTTSQEASATPTTPTMASIASETLRQEAATTATKTSKKNLASNTNLPNKNKNKSSKKAGGIFAPLVIAAKMVLGQDRLNKIRGKVIGMHSDVIADFTKTADTTQFGSNVVKLLFEASDTNKNGTIDRDEFRSFLSGLGFGFLKPKQIDGQFDRADADKNGELDLDEFQKEAPKILKNNLTKLAKENGKDLGFMA